MVRLVLSPIGFDERFLLRLMFMYKIGTEEHKDVMLLFRPDAPHQDPRSNNVISQLNKLKELSKLNVEIIVEKVKVDDFWSGVRKIVNRISHVLEEVHPTNVIINLSGGMRVLLLQLFVGCILLPIDAEVVIYREDLSGYVSFPISVLRKLKKPPECMIGILKVIKENPGITFSELARKLNLPKSTLHVRLEKLIEEQLVEATREGAKLKLSLSPWAFLWV